ncbi:MAG: acyl-CoA thioesterase [Thermoleophilaceae bacterium]
MTDRNDGRGAPNARRASPGVAEAPFVHVERVRFGDLDAMQHMNNVEFLRFFETARIEYLTHLVPDHRPTRRQDFGFIFAECRISYRAPAFYDDDIRTAIRPGEIRRSSLRLEFEMHVGDRLVAEGYGVLVGYDYEAGRSQPLPDELRERLGAAAGSPAPAGGQRAPRAVL